MITLGWKLTMKTLGFIKVVLLPLMILGSIMGSSIASPTGTQERPISEENTSPRTESPNRVRVREELDRSPTGNDITEVLRNLSRILAEMADVLSEEKSSPSTRPSEK